MSAVLSEQMWIKEWILLFAVAKYKHFSNCVTNKVLHWTNTQKSQFLKPFYKILWKFTLNFCDTFMNISRIVTLSLQCSLMFEAKKISTATIFLCFKVYLIRMHSLHAKIMRKLQFTLNNLKNSWFLSFPISRPNSDSNCRKLHFTTNDFWKLLEPTRICEWILFLWLCSIFEQNHQLVSQCVALYSPYCKRRSGIFQKSSLNSYICTYLCFFTVLLNWWRAEVTFKLLLQVRCMLHCFTNFFNVWMLDTTILI